MFLLINTFFDYVGINIKNLIIFISIPFALLKAQNVMKKTLAYCSYLFIIVP